MQLIVADGAYGPPPPPQGKGQAALHLLVLAPGGRLLLSFPATDGPEPPYEYYDHRVAAAYRWWPDHVVSLLRAVGVIETARLMDNPEPDDRRQFQVAFVMAARTTYLRRRPCDRIMRSQHQYPTGVCWH